MASVRRVVLWVQQSPHVYLQLFNDTIASAGKHVHPIVPKHEFLVKFPAKTLLGLTSDFPDQWDIVQIY